MFFSGDPSTRKRVDLGGRSSKERDRRKLIEQTRLERNRRLFQKQQNSAAIKIQKCFRGRRIVEAEHQKMREQFYSTYGKQCENIGRQCLGPDSPYLRQLLFFFNPGNSSDLSAIVETCRILLSCACDHDDIVGLFAGKNFASHSGLVEYRVRKVAYACIQAVYVNRNKFKKDLMLTSKSSDGQTVVLLETLCILIDPKLPWACKTVGYLVHKNSYSLIREIILTGKESMKTQMCLDEASSVEHVLMVMTSHIGEKPCLCTKVEPLQSFSYQILTIPFIWQICPQLKEVYVRQGLSWHYIRQMALCVRSHNNILPDDLSNDFPGYACLLLNMLESASFSLPQSESSFGTAVDFAVVATYLLDKLPSLKSLSREGRENIAQEDDEMPIVDEHVQHVLNEGLGRQISDAIGPRFLIQLTNALLGSVSTVDSNEQGPDDKEVAAVGSICAFLHVTFNSFPLEGKLTTLAYRTGLVPVLWNFMKRCHVNQCWSAVSEQSSVLPQGAPGWLLPLVVFCPVYKHMLMIVDNEEFYARETPLSLKDIRSLIVILRQALWQILWVDPSPQAKSAPAGLAHKKQPLEFLQHRVSVVASELLSQLQDWNNRRQFASPSDFHADHVNDYFISQAMLENTRANDILKQAPFLVPFTSRVKIFTSQLAAARQQHGTHAVFTSNRFRIRRDHILEDAYNQLSALSDDNLRGVIRISFVNELGVEEAGIDGGGIFKDFMENITRAAFDIQYGLFKETADHLLYPNPGSGLVHEQHLQFFYFLGTILAKAMFESILVDIPFATFFLSKLKQKHNYLNDLPSLDPELYRHLIFLKRYEGDISELELYFVIVNNEYGEQMEEELIADGKNIRVTNESVIYFIHLVANHRLNYQIRQQSSHFLRGFQQLIQKGWIDMFNEHELQILISGSLDGLDVDDLRSHTQYSGGYHSEHYVIEMFWEVLKGFSQENQMKFLKFVTGCSRGPLLGFKYLEPQFCIQRAAGSASEEALDRLPTSATCMNLLKLPPYGSKEQLERKLLYAINAEAGFDLS